MNKVNVSTKRKILKVPNQNNRTEEHNNYAKNFTVGFNSILGQAE